MEACMKKLLLAGATALLLTGAAADPTFAAMRGGTGGGAHVSGGVGGGAHVSAGTGFSGRVGTSGGFAAPRAAVTGGFNRSATVAGRTGTWAGRTGTWSGRTGTFAGRTGRGGHWVWRHHRRVFVPFAVGVGVALADTYYDDCVVWDGWRYVNVCYEPYY